MATGQVPEVLAEAVIQRLEEGTVRRHGTAYVLPRTANFCAAESGCGAEPIRLGSSGAEARTSEVLLANLSF